MPSDIPRLQKPWGGPACAVPPPLAPAAAFCSSWVGSKAAVLLGGFSALPHGRLSRPEAPPAAATAPKFLAGPSALMDVCRNVGPNWLCRGTLSVSGVPGAVQLVLRILQTLAEVM